MANTSTINFTFRKPEKTEKVMVLKYMRSVEPEASYCLGGMGYEAWMRLISTNRHDILFIIVNDSEVIGTIENQTKITISNKHQIKFSILEERIREVYKKWKGK